MELNNAMTMIERKNSIAVLPKDAFAARPSAKIVSGDFAHGKNVEDSGVDEQVDNEERTEAGENSRGESDRPGFLTSSPKYMTPSHPSVSVDRGLHAEQHRRDERGSSGDGDSGRRKNFRVGGAAHCKAGNHHHKKTRPFSTVVNLHLAAHADTFPCSSANNTIAETPTIFLMRSGARPDRGKDAPDIHRGRFPLPRWCRRWKSNRSSRQ